MAAPAFAAIQRSSFRGSGAIIWCPTIVNVQSPTRTEINAGYDFVGHVLDGSGFGLESEQIETPDAGSRITGKIPGSITIGDSSLTVYMAKNGVDLRQSQKRDVSGFVLMMAGGDTPGFKMDVWPVTISSVMKQLSFDGSAANTQVINYSPGVPGEDITIPA